MTTTFKAGDRVYLVGGAFDQATFGIWTGTVEKGMDTFYWVRRDGEKEHDGWLADSMFTDRDAAFAEGANRLHKHIAELERQRESALMLMGAVSQSCPATLDAPELVRS